MFYSLVPKLQVRHERFLFYCLRKSNKGGDERSNVRILLAFYIIHLSHDITICVVSNIREY